jgi:hypothetical protein
LLRNAAIMSGGIAAHASRGVGVATPGRVARGRASTASALYALHTPDMK